MTFATTLNEYCVSLGFTNKELADCCGLSASSISRYRSGERTPDYRSGLVGELAEAIVTLSRERGNTSAEIPTADEIRSVFERELSDERMRGLALGARLNQLMTCLELRNSELASRLGIDPSYLSRIRNQQRIPADQQQFARKSAQIIAALCLKGEKVEHLTNTIAIPGLKRALAEPKPITCAQLAKLLRLWLTAAD